MEQFTTKLLDAINERLQLIDLDGCDISIEDSVGMINFLEKNLIDLREFFFSQGSINTDREILFFKELKPKILGLLLYFNKVHTIELKCPNGSNDTLKEHYQSELDSLTYFFERNLDFYQYYRSNSTHLDEIYFTRNKRCHQLCYDSVHFIMDAEFSTGYDYKIAKIICNEMLRIYLNKKKHGLEKQEIIKKNREKMPVNNLKWTASKASVLLRISRRTLQEYRTAGVFPYYLICGKIVYKESELVQLLEDCRKQSLDEQELI